MAETMVKLRTGPAKDAKQIRRLALKLQRESLTKRAQDLLLEIRSRATNIEQAIESLEEKHFLESVEQGEVDAPLDDEQAVSPEVFSPEDAGLAIVKAMKEGEGGAWSGKELQERFGLTSATLHRRRNEHRIIFWRDARHDFFYPKWQFTGTGALLRGIQEVLGVFRSDDEWRIMRYFLGKREQLENRRPIDLIRGAEVEKVIDHARLHVAENTW